MDYLVSIIMPAYNAEEHIAQSLRSALSQTWKQIEVIVVDDGSTDRTAEIVHSFSDSRIKYFYQDNGGQCSASNLGIALSEGDYIKFFDADDLMNELHVELLLGAISGKDDEVCFCSWARFSSDIAKVKPVVELYSTSSVPVEWLKLSLSCKYDMMPAWFWLIPRQLLKRAGGWNEQLSLNNDFEFSIRLLLHAKYVHYVPGALIYYRSGSPSLSAIKSELSFKKAIHSARLGCCYLLEVENSLLMRRLCANKLCFWLFEMYPDYPALIRELENDIKMLGGANRKLDDSRLMHFIQFFVGWKNAKLIKTGFYRSNFGRFIKRVKS